MHIIIVILQAVRKAALSVALLLIPGFSVRAETIVVDNDDGSATVVIVGGSYLVDRNVHLDFGWRDEGRDSTVESDDYRSNIVGLNVRLQH